MILAIDPGPVESAYVLYDERERSPLKQEWAKVCNDDLLHILWLRAWRADRLAVEMIASYGMPVGAETFETCVWIGRFIQRWTEEGEGAHELVYRREVKLHLCDSARAKDGNVRQALIDRYGGKEQAIGKKAAPGPLYGMAGDCWAALGVAVTAAERGVKQ